MEKLPEGLEQDHKTHIQQAYLSTDPVVRVRRIDEEYVLTCKGPAFSAGRSGRCP